MLVDRWGQPLAGPPAAAPGRASRMDSWANGMTGIGTAADKTTHGRYMPVRRITDAELVSLYNGSALAAKICSKRPIEMFRRGYDLRCGDKEVDASGAKELQEHASEDLEIDSTFLQAKTFADVLGGYLVIMGIDDGNPPEEPLDESRIRSFTYLNGIDRRFSYVLDWYTEPGPKFGRPQRYLISNAISGFRSGYGRNARTERIPGDVLRSRGYFTAVVHETRCLRFEGVSTDIVTMQSLAGWTWSVLQRVYDALRKFEHDFDSASYLLSDAAQAVFTLKGMMDAISAGETDAMEQRALEIEKYRSVMKAVILEDGETFTRQPTPLTGVSDILDKMMLRLSAEADYPVTELFGRAASGLSGDAASSEERRKFYGDTSSRQKSELGPLYKRAYRLLSLARDCPVKLPKTTKNGKPLKWEAKFKPLYEPTDEEQAKVDLLVAQRDQVYLAEEVVSKEEVALDRAELYPSMDVEAREEALEGLESFDPHANDPDPPDPNAGEKPSPDAVAPPGSTVAPAPKAPKASPAAPAPTVTAKPSAKKPKPKGA